MSRQCTSTNRSDYCNAHYPINPVVLGTEDIADPKHPLRFHQFITNMKRSPASPLLAEPQDSPETVDADPDALSSQQAQPPHASPDQTLPDQGLFDQTSTSGLTPTGQPLTASLDKGAEAASRPGSSGQRKADASPPTSSGSGSSSTSQSTGAAAGSESGTVQSLFRDLAGLVSSDDLSRTLSLGGPVPGGQVGFSLACMTHIPAGSLFRVSGPSLDHKPV